MINELSHTTQWKQFGPYRVLSELFLDVIFTERCNRACPYCIAATRNRAEADDERYTYALKKAFEIFDIRSVIILGGEATIDPRFFEKLSAVTDLCRARNIDRIILTTNGTQLVDRGFLRQLCISGIHAVNLSRMHYDQTANDLAFGGATPSLREIGVISGALSDSGISLRLNANVWRGNLDTPEELDRYIDAVRDVCGSVKFSPLMDTGMFGTLSRVEHFTRTHALSADAIRLLFDAWAARHHDQQRRSDILGFVDYARVNVSGFPVYLKYAQVEDRYDRAHVIPTLKLYPNGCLSNEWNCRRDLLPEFISIASSSA